MINNVGQRDCGLTLVMYIRYNQNIPKGSNINLFGISLILIL